LGVWEKYRGPTTERPMPKDTSILWFGYRGTNYAFAQDAVVLVSENGSRSPLTLSGYEDYPDVSEHLLYLDLPSLLTNRGKYSLTLPSLNQTLVTFEYE
jgi:hypothetical protein